jgi:GDP/UDP-N,N'-diacetylbacillosamine 2-epimerase (hydrolysing)
MRKVCIFTSTRAEWGLQRGVAELICQSDELRLQLLVSGSHLSERHGMTIREIEADGFTVNARVDILRFDDSPSGICKSMGEALGGYGEALEILKPDLLVILGDRYESFCAAAAAQIQRIPIAHIHGGETTEGAVDEAFRHSITKMAHLHFPSCEEYRRRIIQLGEDPARVFNVGALGLENIRKINLMNREELATSIGFGLDRPFFLVTFHPVTLENATSGEQFDQLLQALEQFPDHGIIFTKANADTDGQIINDRIDAYAVLHPDRCLAVASLGLHRYLSAMKICDAVVGNSSSGILETPAFGVPTINIGDRQKGRIRTKSIIDCEPNQNAIVAALQKTLDPRFRDSLQGMVHPCEQEHTAMQIVKKIQQANLDGLLKKSFYDLESYEN